MRIVLGHEVPSKKPVSVSDAALARGLYTVGVLGSGKSTFLLNLAIQYMLAGFGLGVIDPHYDLTHDILIRVPAVRLRDVVILDFADYRFPPSINLFACNDPLNPKRVAEVHGLVMDLFWNLFSEFWGPRFQQQLEHVVYALIANQGYSMAVVPRFLSDETYRQGFMDRSRYANPQVVDFWENEYRQIKPEDRNPVLNKVESLTHHPIIGPLVSQRQNKMDMRSVIQQSKILIVRIPPTFGELFTQLAGGLVIGALKHAFFAQLETKHRLPFALLCDEFQLYCE